MLWLLAPIGLLVLAAVAWFGVGYTRFARYHRHKGLQRQKVAFLPYAVREGLAILTLGVWHLRAAFADGLRTPAVVSGPPVLCLHGITQTGSNLWGIRRALEARGRPTRAVSFGRWPAGRQHLVGLLGPEIERLAERSPTGRVDVVAHSLGGVVLRLVLADRPDLAPRIGRVVTLGSPHGGTASLRGLPLGKAVHRLGRRSPLLAGLPSIPADHITTVAAEPDLIVYPASTCHLPGSRRVDLLGVGHCGLITRPEAIAAVVHALCDAPG